MVQPWFLGSEGDGVVDDDFGPSFEQWADVQADLDRIEQQRHDELLRMRCVELAWGDGIDVARLIYHDVTGREWPEWPINRKGTISCEPT